MNELHFREIMKPFPAKILGLKCQVNLSREVYFVHTVI